MMRASSGVCRLRVCDTHVPLKRLLTGCCFSVRGELLEGGCCRCLTGVSAVPIGAYFGRWRTYSVDMSVLHRCRCK
eukprot:4557364-Alexandrium_andersonii.AAC.1